MSRKILLDLKLDRETVERVSQLVAMHQRANGYEEDWTDGAVRRFVREAGEVLEDLLDLSAADVTSKRQERQRAASSRVSALRERIERLRAEEEIEKLASPLDGLELMAMFDRPRSVDQAVKDRLLSAVLDGQLAPDDKEGAAVMARELMAETAEVCSRSWNTRAQTGSDRCRASPPARSRRHTGFSSAPELSELASAAEGSHRPDGQQPRSFASSG